MMGAEILPPLVGMGGAERGVGLCEDALDVRDGRHIATRIAARSSLRVTWRQEQRA